MRPPLRPLSVSATYFPVSFLAAMAMSLAGAGISGQAELKTSSGLDLISQFGARKPGPVPRLAWKLAIHRSLDRKYRKIIRKRIASRFPGPFDVDAEGVMIRAYPLENYCDRIAVGRGMLPERTERSLIMPYLKPRTVFVDIGANIGTYSLFVARTCSEEARVLAFEPHPRTYSKLMYNAKANGFSRIEIVNRGIGPVRSQMRLFSSGGTNIGTASILPDAAGDKEHVDIEIVPLSDALKSHLVRHVDLLKADIEGYEDQALMPLMTPENEALWPRAILIETVLKQHWKEDCIEHLMSLGYSLAGDTGENMLLLHPMTEKLGS